MHNIALSALFPMRPIAPVIHTPPKKSTARTQRTHPRQTRSDSDTHLETPSCFVYTCSPRGNVAYHKRITTTTTTPLALALTEYSSAEPRLGTSDLARRRRRPGTEPLTTQSLASPRACRAGISPFFALMATAVPYLLSHAVRGEQGSGGP